MLTIGCHAGLDPASEKNISLSFPVPSKTYYVYMMTNFSRSVLYIGVTNDIRLRVLQHRSGEGSVFTSRYRCFYLLHFEEYFQIDAAIAREKQLKNWHRDWKDELIKKENPDLKDLSESWYD